MNAKIRTFCGVLVFSLAASAMADESVGLVENVAVRNRLFSVSQRFELGANAGFTLLSRLTQHYNLTLSGAYNFNEWLGLELRAGYAISMNTDLAKQVQTNFQTSSVTTASDLADLWRMTANAVIGARFQPVYGKINLVAELPIHFQLYLWAGGGLGIFRRDSLVLCLDATASTCKSYYSQTQAGPLVSLAVGFRFFVVGGHSIKLELRDHSYLDSYYENVDRTQITPTSPTGRPAAVATTGITNLVQLDVGYAFLF